MTKVAADRHPCSERVYGERCRSWICLKTAKVERNGKWFCGVHDPEAKKRKRELESSANLLAANRERLIFDAAKELAKKLGCGDVFYRHSFSGRGGGYERKLVITFEDAEAIIAERSQRASKL